MKGAILTILALRVARGLPDRLVIAAAEGRFVEQLLHSLLERLAIRGAHFTLRKGERSLGNVRKEHPMDLARDTLDDQSRAEDGMRRKILKRFWIFERMPWRKCEQIVRRVGSRTARIFGRRGGHNCAVSILFP